ncbi:MAG TPA: MASE1 domain-containing protein [Ramlibacter sp.]|uniref:MASE1 domain-containing protein n=1 Tax=Ramlibacter sp. TaxID=1917967 RepID=UPI002BE7B12E|nr:MASE1 domain-containing protein [Ramlibacter sp.]HVZ45157.1 MASE1 domain-containing protein [Ramlibacter sp.]
MGIAVDREPPWQHTPAQPGAALAIGFLLAYVSLDWVSFVHPMRGLNITPWNPQAGLAVALLIWRPRAWWLAGLAVAIGEMLARPASVVDPLFVSLLAAVALAAGYALTAALLARWPGLAQGVASRKRIATLLAVVAAGALAASLLHVAVLALIDASVPERLASAIYRAWIGESVGMLVTLPLISVLAQREGRARSKAMARSVEWWLAVLVACLATLALFARPPDEQFRLFYLLFVPVVWAAARFGLAGAVWSAILVQVLLIVAVQSAQYRPLTVFELQVLMAVLGATGLLLGGTVDEREEAERSLRATLRQAAAGDMAAALAHELNQPLAAMTTYARASQLLAERFGESDAQAAQPLVSVSGKLVQEAGRAGEIVRRLRDFFRERTTQLALVGLAELLDEAMQSQAARAHALGLRLDWYCDAGVPPLWLDRVQIGVVLRNLVANAIDAAAAPPRHDEPAVHVRIRIDDGDVVVSVLDTGAGLAVSDIASVFESRPSGKAGGMGVGLGISRLIVDAHGGRMWAEPGPGGRFFFSLPAAGPHHEA